MSVADLIDLFTVEHVDAKLKAGTAQGYKIALEKLRAAHGGIKASQLTRAQVAALHAWMRGNPYGANRFLAITSKLFSWGGDRGWLSEGHANPAAKIGRYKMRSGRSRSRMAGLKTGRASGLSVGCWCISLISRPLWRAASKRSPRTFRTDCRHVP